MALVSLEPDFLDRAKALLEAGGYTTVAFDRPDTALQAFASIRFDVLVTTIVLGSSNGFAFAEQARALAPQLQVLLASRTKRRSAPRAEAFAGLLEYEFTVEGFERRVNPGGAAARRARETVEVIRLYLDNRMAG